MGRLFNNTIFHLLLIVLIGLIIYSNTFHVPFHWDDTPNIAGNYKLRDSSNLWPPSGSRWFGVLTFAFNYYLGGLNPFGYHIANLIVHILNAILVYCLMVLTFKTPFFSHQQSAISNQQSEETNFDSSIDPFTYLPLFIALIFVSHPIQTQAVTYIVQRFTSLATMFYLLSLVMYIRFRIQDTEFRIQESEERPIPYALHPTRYHFKRYTLYAVSLISAVLAMKTKEIAFTLPFIITLYEFSFLNKLPSKTGRLKRFLYLAPFLLTLLIIPLSLVSLDKPLGDAIGELRETSQETEEIPRWSYLITQSRVIVTYLRLFFIPMNQNLDYDYPLYKSFFEPNVFLSVIFLLSISGSCIYLFYAKRCTLNAARLIAFGIFWFFMTLSVESSVIPIRDAINEHRLYLPGIGLIIAFTSSLSYAWKFMGQHRRFAVFSSTVPLIIFMTVITTVFSVAAHQRNSVWQDEVKLWEDAARKSPRKTRTHINLGVAYHKQGLLNEAVREYKTALMLKPDYAIAHNNLGNVYYSQGLTHEAVQEYKDALRLDPSLAETHYNIGNIYMSEGRLNEAVQEYRAALGLNPGYAEAHSSLGFVYYEQGRLNETVQEFLTALQFNSYNPDIRNNLGNVYMKLGQIDDAIAHYQAALRLEPNHAITHNNLGLAYKRKGLINEAAQEFQAALRINPGLFQARQNLESLQR